MSGEWERDATPDPTQAFTGDELMVGLETIAWGTVAGFMSESGWQPFAGGSEDFLLVSGVSAIGDPMRFVLPATLIGQFMEGVVDTVAAMLLESDST